MTKVTATTTLSVSIAGKDAVSYRIVATATAVAFRQTDEGLKADVEKVSAKVVKQEGDRSPEDVSFERMAEIGLTMKYGLLKDPDNLVPYKGGERATNKVFKGFRFVLYKDGVEIDRTDVPFIFDGTDGSDGQDGKDGEDGKDGQDGEDSVRYWLQGSVTQAVRDALGTCTPARVSCRAMKQAGNGAATECGAEVELQYSENRGEAYVEIKEYAGGEPIRIGAGTVAVDFYLYRGEELADTLTIPVVKDGSVGPRGANGRMPIPYGEYDAETSYTATDLVAPYVLEDGQYYVMNKTTTVRGLSPKADYAANGTEATWLLMERFKAIYAELLMARLGVIGKAVFYDEFMMSQYGRKAGEEVNYAGGYDVPTEAGGTFDPNILINFLTGALRCRKAEITGTVNAESGRIGSLAIRGNDLVGLIDGVEAVRIGVGAVTDVTAAFESRSIVFAMESDDRECRTGVETTQFGYTSGWAHRPGEMSEDREDGSYRSDTTLSCRVRFTLEGAATKVSFGRFDVGYETASGSFAGSAVGTAKLYRVSGSTRTKVSEWSLEEQSYEDHEVASLSAGSYEVEVTAWLVAKAGVQSTWTGTVTFNAGGIWVTSGALSSGRVEIARDGLLCYQGDTRYMFFSKGKGFEARYGSYGLKLGSGGLQKLVGGEWKSL